MSKPQVSNKIISIEGNKIKQLSVAFSNSKRKILILDNRFNLDHDIHRSTFTNLCFETCKTLKQSNTFVYIEAGRLSSSQLLTLISKHKPDGIMFASISVFNKTGLDPLKYFCYVRKWNKIPTILTTDFHKWTATEGFEKGESGKSLIGFNLKHLVAVTQGKNLFTDITEKDTEFKLYIIRTIRQFDKFYNLLVNKKVVAIDTEADNLTRTCNTAFTHQYAFKHKGEILVYVLPWEQKNHTWSKKDLTYINNKLKQYFYHTDAEHVYHFCQFDIGLISQSLGLKFYPAKVWDTIGAQYAIDENFKFLDNIHIGDSKFKPYSLSSVENMYGIHRPNDIIAKEDRANMARFSLEDIAKYGAYDVANILVIRERQIECSTHPLVGYTSEGNYKKLVIYQLGMMMKTFSMLMDTGIYIDMDNAKNISKIDGVFETTVNNIRHEIISTKNGDKANNILLSNQGIAPSGGMFSSKKPEILSLTKPSHLRTLFFDVMRLEPTKQGKSGESSTDKSFQKAYKHIKEVKLFSQFNKVKTLKLNFADAILKRYKKDKDFQNDGRLRPFFGFTRVTTGRLSVISPNSQNVPAHDDPEFEGHKALIKSIKANFSVKRGRVMRGSDFSAHEIRVAGIIAKDKTVKKLFNTANEAIRQFRLATPKNFDEAKANLKKKGDIHIMNIKNLFGLEVDKSHPLRSDVKATVFSTIYSASVKSIAKNIKNNSRDTANRTLKTINGLIDKIKTKLSNG